MCSAWIPCHTFRTATAAVRLSSEPWVRRDVISSVRRLARVRSWVMCYLEKKKQGNRVDYYYYPYFNCFSCHSDSSFLTHSVLSRFFMSDVSVRSIPMSLKMEFIKKEWGRPLKLFTETLERDWWYFDAEDHSSSSVCFAPAVMTFEKTSRTCTQKKSSSGRLPLSMVLKSLWAPEWNNPARRCLSFVDFCLFPPLFKIPLRTLQPPARPSLRSSCGMKTSLC